MMKMRMTDIPTLSVRRLLRLEIVIVVKMYNWYRVHLGADMISRLQMAWFNFEWLQGKGMLLEV